MLSQICNFYLISGARPAQTGLISNQNYILHTLQPDHFSQPGYRGWSEPGQRYGDAPRIDQITRASRTHWPSPGLTTGRLLRTSAAPSIRWDLLRELSIKISVRPVCCLLFVSPLTCTAWTLWIRANLTAFLRSEEPTWRPGLSRAWWWLQPGHSISQIWPRDEIRQDYLYFSFFTTWWWGIYL